MALDSAKSIIADYLNQFGLGDLADWAWGTYIDSGGGDLGTQAVNATLPDQPSFKARFPAYDTLAKSGHAMSPAEMISYEKSVTGLMREAGLPPGFYDQPEDFAKLMIRQLSPSEVQSRVQTAQSDLYNAPPETRQALADFYGIPEGEQAAMFLDPEIALPVLQNRWSAATAAGLGRQQGINLNQTTAEQIAQTGVSQDQIRQGVGEVAANQGLYRTTLEEAQQGQGNVDVNTGAQAVFQLNPTARKAIERRKAQRVGAFQGGAGYNAGQGGVAGLQQTRQ